jgi:hypothetical protein
MMGSPCDITKCIDQMTCQQCVKNNGMQYVCPGTTC